MPTAPPAACALLGVADPGSARAYEVPSSGPIVCRPGTSDGTGNPGAAHLWIAHRRAWFVEPGGTTLSTWDGHFLQVAGKNHGFLLADLIRDEASGRGFALWAFKEVGTLEATLIDSPQVVGTGPRSSFVARNWSSAPEPRTRLGALLSFDADGQQQFAIQTGPGCKWQDRMGNTLGHNGWIDARGNPGPLANVSTGPLPQSYAISLQPRIDGGFFVQLTDTATGVRRWVAQIDSLGLLSTPAPAWLARRPDIRVQVIRGGLGYALLPVAGACSQQVEIVAPDGTGCGSVALPDLQTDCAASSIDVGLDGTVIQQLPPSAGCTWRYWPGYFR